MIYYKAGHTCSSTFLCFPPRKNFSQIPLQQPSYPSPSAFSNTISQFAMADLTELPYKAAMLLIKVYKGITWCAIHFLLPYLKADFIRKGKELDVTVNGPEPWHLQVHDERLFFQAAQDKTLGVGEAYMDGWWDCEQLDELWARMVRGGMFKELMHPPDYVVDYVRFRLFNLQTVTRSWEVAEKHYNIGNKLFESFLDPSMNYSCAYWKNASTLEEAQRNKMDLIARKLKLKKGMRVLDIGCGWGALCKYLAETYEVSVVGVTVSEEGARFAREKCAGLPVDIRVQDYRSLNEKFDRVVGVEILEHVGIKNYRTFMEVVNRCLADDGIFLLHVIGVDNDCLPQTDPFILKYIFPNSMVPLHSDIPKAIHNIFNIEDWHNIGAHFDKTYMAWHANFVRNWDGIKDLFENPERFFRMWTFYMLGFAGLFRSRKFHVWQIVLTKGLPGGYESVR